MPCLWQYLKRCVVIEALCLINHINFMRFLLSILATSFFCCAAAQKSFYKSIDTNCIKKHVLTLASDSFQGRYTFSPGGTKTINYLNSYFKKSGLQPGNGKSFIQQVDVVHTHAELSSIIEVKTKTKNWSYKMALIMHFILFHRMAK